jgi:hypothetical protein
MKPYNVIGTSMKAFPRFRKKSFKDEHPFFLVNRRNVKELGRTHTKQRTNVP